MYGKLPSDSYEGITNKVTSATIYWKIGDKTVSPTSYTGCRDLTADEINKREVYHNVKFSEDTIACTYLKVNCNYGSSDANNSNWEVSGTYYKAPKFNVNPTIESNKTKNTKGATYTAKWTAATPGNSNSSGTFSYSVQTYYGDLDESWELLSEVSTTNTEHNISDQLTANGRTLKKGDSIGVKVKAIFTNSAGYSFETNYLENKIIIESSGVLNAKVSSNSFQESSNVYVRVDNSNWKEVSDVYVYTSNGWKESI